ncbi:hypothetical protein [Bacillus sp. NPDC094077]|uniref:hypothetical protein n=1 Tax=Bacillus sp. NPDC094077 TaxID=3390932 RepID=UPI003CFD81E6
MGELKNQLVNSYPSCQRIRLTVHPDNIAGQKFYKKMVFVDENLLTYNKFTYSLYLHK